MKSIKIILFAAVLTANAKAQNCKAYVFNKGQKLVFENKAYPPTFESDMSMITGDTKYKIKNSIAFNEKIASGKIVPKKTAEQVMTINNVTQENGKTAYDIDMTGAAMPISMKIFCAADTQMNVMFNGRYPYVPKGDTTGIFLYGPVYYPANAKVGSRIRGSVNISIIATDNTDQLKYRKFFSTPFIYNERSPGSYYELVTNASGPLKAMAFGISIAQPGLVLREEKITIGGKEYTASVIGTETWMKTMTGSLERSFLELEGTYLQLPDMSKKIMQAPSFEPGGKRVWEKKSGEAFDVNKYGFMPTYREEWVVAGMGSVKTISYDGNGAISSITELKSVQ